MKIKNITIREYLELEYTNIYTQASEYIEPKNSFNGKRCDIMSLTYDEVTLVKKLYSNPQVEGAETLFSICFKEEDFLNCRIIDFYQAKKWLDLEVVKLLEKEKNMLYRPPDIKLQMAGSDNLKRYGNMVTKIDIGAQFGYKPSDVGKWRYIDVLFIQAVNTTTSEIRRNLATIK